MRENNPHIPFVNMSTRGKVLTGEGVMIAGFAISGPGAKSVILRGLGPSLNSFIRARFRTEAPARAHLGWSDDRL
jgi:hypothetical protein